MLVVPHGRDQNDIAARVTARGAGLMLEPSASMEEMRGALQALLETESFRHAAKALGDKVLADIANSPFAEELEDLATQHFLPDRTPQICLA
jgi:UDP:flavonoid glycosyltransferase YjiC (YdhE family)